MASSRFAYLASLLAFIALWACLALVLNQPDTLPSPFRVAAIAAHEAKSGELGFHVAATLARVAAAFALAMGFGVAIGLALGLWRRLDDWMGPWVIVFLNIPALVVIVLAYLWIGLTEVAAIAAVAINKFPMVVVTVREGARRLDPTLDDIAHVFRFSRWRRLRHVIAPQLAPYIAASARNGLAIIWKIVLVVEFLGRSNGVGFQIHLYFQLFEIGHVMAYAFSFVAIVLALDLAAGLLPGRKAQMTAA